MPAGDGRSHPGRGASIRAEGLTIAFRRPVEPRAALSPRLPPKTGLTRSLEGRRASRIGRPVAW